MIVMGGASGGASVLPSAGVFASGCASGAAGGVVTHIITGGRGDEYDTSAGYDSYQYLNNKVR